MKKELKKNKVDIVEIGKKYDPQRTDLCAEDKLFEDLRIKGISLYQEDIEEIQKSIIYKDGLIDYKNFSH